MTNERVVYKDRTYGVQTSGRYYQSYNRNDPERLLHRRVWSDANGLIPLGMHIHHKDNDWRNNALENLEMIEGGEHRSMHLLERIARGEMGPPSAEALAKAAEWHASPEGIEWHRGHGRASWKTRKPHVAVCSVCRKNYETYFPRRSSYCSDACGQRKRLKRYFTEIRQCAWCGNDFTTNRHRPTVCCSHLCGNRKRAAEGKNIPGSKRVDP